MRFRAPALAATALATVVVVAGCSRDTSLLEPAPFPSNPEVFLDNFAPGVDYAAFSGAKAAAIEVDGEVARTGEASLRIDVPNFGDPEGSFAGGVLFSNVPRDLTSYNALSLWVRASSSATIDVLGLGNDNSGTSRYSAQRNNIPVSSGWTRVVIPIPDADKLQLEAGMFWFAEGPENNLGRSIWLDDIQYTRIAIDSVEPVIPTETRVASVGQTIEIDGTTSRYVVGGESIEVGMSADYFTFESSDPSVASVSATGEITVVGPGEATITGSLDGVPATGAVTVGVVATPTEAPAAPTRDPQNVISLFSDSYTNVPVDRWSADFDPATDTDLEVTGGTIKRYTGLGFAVAEFVSNQVDASEMTHLHVDVWVVDDTEFKIKLVDFGPDGAFGGGDDIDPEITLSAPEIVAGQWNSLDIPLSRFPGLSAQRANVAQLITSGSSSTVFYDNIYFYKFIIPEAPLQAAPVPTRPAGDVIALFSDAYDENPVDTWSTVWDNADVTDVSIDGDNAKLYENVVFAGIEFIGTQVDASDMTHFHVDVWTPTPTDDPNVGFIVELVDFGPNRAFDGGDDTKGVVRLTSATSPPLAAGQWMSLDIPLASFAANGLAAREALSQMLFVGDLGKFWVDNVYFYRDASASAVTAPTVTPRANAGAATPLRDAGLFR